MNCLKEAREISPILLSTMEFIIISHIAVQPSLMKYAEHLGIQENSVEAGGHMLRL